jgi:hypothetical protein
MPLLGLCCHLQIACKSYEVTSICVDTDNHRSFLKWNLPYAAMRGLYAGPFNHNSPFGLSIPTPGSELSVDTPPAASPGNAPSPTAVLLKGKPAIDRAHLFAQGQHDKLLMSMDGEERR